VLQERLARVEALLLASNTALSEPQTSPATVTPHEAQSSQTIASVVNVRDTSAEQRMLPRLPDLPCNPESVQIQLLPSPSVSTIIEPPTFPTGSSVDTCRSEEDDGSSVVPPEEEVGWTHIAHN
jgi:hypothetical protein